MSGGGETRRLYNLEVGTLTIMFRPLLFQLHKGAATPLLQPLALSFCRSLKTESGPILGDPA